MKYQTPVNVKVTSGPRVADGAPDSGHCYDSFPRDKPAVPRLQGRRRKINKQKAWASIFSTLAVLAMLVTCIRGVHVRASIAGARRKLAIGENDEDHERAAILELCLDLQEETGVIRQQAAPLPGPDEAIPAIFDFLEFTQAAGPQQIFPFSFASSESAAPAPTSEPGPTDVVAAGWGAGHMQAWEDPEQSAEGEVPPHVEDEGVAGPSPALLQRCHETSLRGTTVTPYQPPVFQINVTAGSHPFSSALSALSRKRGITESEGSGTENLAKQTRVEGASQQPWAKKHTSGWKIRTPSSSSVSFPPVQQHSQEVAAEVPDKNPIFQAMQALRAIWSLEPWESSGTAGDASPATSPEEEGTYTSPVQTMPHGLQHPEMHLYPFKEPLSGLGLPTSPASAGSFLPSTSLGLGRPWEALPQSPLPGPSRPAPTEISTPMPLPSGADRSLGQTSSTNLQTHSDQSPLASHRFYRLPTLLPGPIPRRFNPAKAFTLANSRTRPIVTLGVIRSFLVRAAITPQDAATLVACSEVLAGRLYHELQLPLDDVKTSKLVEHLGRAFFALDALLSVIELVGPPMDAQGWWPKLASVIPQQTSFPLKPRVSAATVYNARLAARLGAALQTLRSGQRLGAEETVELKRELLSRLLTVTDFKDRKWDPWRDDDEKSSAGI